MAIQKRFIHFKKFSDFNSKKLSANEANTQYTVGVSGEVQDGEPDVLYQSYCWIKDTGNQWTHGQLYKSVNWDVLEPEVAGDIAYWDGSKVKTISQEKWDASLGTAVGVVVIPEGFAPDGKARMLSLNWASSSSTSSTSASNMKWAIQSRDISLTNHNRVPTTDNAGSTTTGSNDDGYLPSDKFNGVTSYVDSTAKYYRTSNMIPSPYLGDKPNPAYYAEISGYNNKFADFDGKGNTDVLVGLGADYEAANAARNYKAAGAEEIEWYLPSMGELGYMMVRFNKIQAALTKVNSPQLADYFYWSSSEIDTSFACCITTVNGYILKNSYKTSFAYVRPFAIIP